ncbi:hypothetical protein JAAARDRAFT_198490 [Jaapia argillacea MUCL 33604]|uniref:NADH:flavin oxidoreductase/NADH oxidase N-terminal domain-containing protein n=1 Tax=Jaapia argillacea MUCL 33604 TaxID=933084 RepID=A0A067PBD0_9AGAM|nr:hypothetical protein JAAARDRAFT_198490 [Jaapia argillacea MUCL 33604]
MSTATATSNLSAPATSSNCPAPSKSNSNPNLRPATASNAGLSAHMRTMSVSASVRLATSVGVLPSGSVGVRPSMLTASSLNHVSAVAKGRVRSGREPYPTWRVRTVRKARRVGIGVLEGLSRTWCWVSVWNERLVGIVAQPMGVLNKEGLTEHGSGDSGSDSDSTQPSSNESDSGSYSTKYYRSQSDAGSHSTKHSNNGSESDGSDSTRCFSDESDSGSNSTNNSDITNENSTHDYNGRIQPTEMTKEVIDQVVKASDDAARRAVKAGFDVVEIDCGLGSLFSLFLNPNVNRRTDRYGGTFEGRMGLVLEAVDRVRAVVPDSMPFFVW